MLILQPVAHPPLVNSQPLLHTEELQAHVTLVFPLKLLGVHAVVAPQSIGQLEDVSPLSQTLLPQLLTEVLQESAQLLPLG